MLMVEAHFEFFSIFNQNNNNNLNNRNLMIFFKATGFKNREEEDSYDVDGTSLFRVRGTCPEDVMTTQIQPESVSIDLCRMRNQLEYNMYVIKVHFSIF